MVPRTENSELVAKILTLFSWAAHQKTTEPLRQFFMRCEGYICHHALQ